METRGQANMQRCKARTSNAAVLRIEISVSQRDASRFRRGEAEVGDNSDNRSASPSRALVKTREDDFPVEGFCASSRSATRTTRAWATWASLAHLAIPPLTLSQPPAQPSPGKGPATLLAQTRPRINDPLPAIPRCPRSDDPGSAFFSLLVVFVLVQQAPPTLFFPPTASRKESKKLVSHHAWR